MKLNLDRWIKDAKDEVPDSGEYRRLNLLLLKERMSVAGPRRRRRHRLLLVFAILVFLLFLTGQLNIPGHIGGNGGEAPPSGDFSGGDSR